MESSSGLTKKVSTEELQQQRCEDCCELLLSAGYEQCQVEGIDDFDRVVGGIVWCIDKLEYVPIILIAFEENASTEKRIAIVDRICLTLLRIGCPIVLNPNKVQELDFSHIYPVVYWLVRTLYEVEIKKNTTSNFSEWFSQYSEKICETTIEDIQKARKDFIERLRAPTKSPEDPGLRNLNRIHQKLWMWNKTAKTTLAEYVKELREGSSLVPENVEIEEEPTSTQLEETKKIVQKQIEEAIIELYKDEIPKDKEDREKLEQVMESYDLYTKIENLEKKIEMDAIEFLEAKEENERLTKTWEKVQTTIQNTTDDDAEKISTLITMFSSAKKRSKELRQATVKTLTEIEEKIIKARLNLDAETGKPKKYDAVLRDAIDTLEMKKNRRCEYAREVAHHQRRLDEALTATLKAQYHKRTMERANNMVDLNRQMKNMMLEYNSAVDILQLSTRCQQFVNKIEETIFENAINSDYRKAFINYMADVRAQLSEYQWKAKMTQDNLISEKQKLAKMRNAIKMKHREMIEKAKYLESVVKVNQQLQEYCNLLDLMATD